MFRLFLVKSLPVPNSSRNELRELIGWHHANGVEVEVAAVFARGLRMETPEQRLRGGPAGRRGTIQQTHPFHIG